VNNASAGRFPYPCLFSKSGFGVFKVKPDKIKQFEEIRTELMGKIAYLGKKFPIGFNLSNIT
jgi:hypothetical protein